MVTKPERTNAKSSFEQVQRLRDTNDVVVFAKACCSGDLEVLKKMAEIADSERLAAETARMQGYVDSANVLLDRIRNTIDLVSVVIRRC